MRILKRIIYTLLGLLIAGTVALVVIILYAEYSGNRFTQDSIPALAKLESAEDESRLAYDENDNLAEIPKDAGNNTADNTGSSGASSSAADSTDSSASGEAAGIGETAADSSASGDTGSSNTGTDTADNTDTADTAASASSGAEEERPYVMDLGSAIFHTADCSYAANIAADKRSEMTTTSAKIMNAGYQPCTNCHPDTR